MNHASFSLTAAAVVALALFASPAPVQSQTGDAAPKTPTQLLIELKVSNEALLKRQQELLLKLEDLKTQADQLRIFSKRS